MKPSMKDVLEREPDEESGPSEEHSGPISVIQRVLGLDEADAMELATAMCDMMAEEGAEPEEPKAPKGKPSLTIVLGRPKK